jgi:hypothetical protein
MTKWMILAALILTVTMTGSLRAQNGRDLNPTRDPDVQRGIDNYRRPPPPPPETAPAPEPAPSTRDLYEHSRHGGDTKYDVNKTQEH